MKTRSFLSLAVIPAFFAPIAVLADGYPGGASSTQTRVLLMDDQGDGRVHPVSATQTFFDGQRFRLSVRARQEGYLYVLCQTSQGEAKVLYPTEVGENNLMQNSSARVFPQRGWYRFDRTPGTEQIFVILSGEPIAELDQAIGGRDMGMEALMRYAGAGQGQNSQARGIEVDGPGQIAVQTIALRHAPAN